MDRVIGAFCRARLIKSRTVFVVHVEACGCGSFRAIVQKIVVCGHGYLAFRTFSVDIR